MNTEQLSSGDMLPPSPSLDDLVPPIQFVDEEVPSAGAAE